MYSLFIKALRKSIGEIKVVGIAHVIQICNLLNKEAEHSTRTARTVNMSIAQF